MNLDPQERTALARFFAKRFPTDEERADLAREAGLPVQVPPATSVVTAWERLLDDAEARHRLGRLGRVAARRDPTDDNLQRAARLLAVGEPRLRGVALAGLAVGLSAVALVAVGGVAWWSGSFAPSNAVAAAPEAPVAPEGRADAVAEAPSGDGPDGSGDAVEAPPRPDEVPPPAEIGEGASPGGAGTAEEAGASGPAGAAHLPAAPSTAPAHHAGRCTQAGGGLVGYWWAGEASPGEVGDVVEVPVDLNVRAWAPNAGNGFDLTGPVRCVLVAGDRIRLSHAPVEIPGGAVWVPLYSGDLLPSR